jgi:hypothetical protein
MRLPSKLAVRACMTPLTFALSSFYALTSPPYESNDRCWKLSIDVAVSVRS